MGFRTGAYAKVWKVENKGKYSVAEMSTSKKNKETDKYENDWSNKFVRLVTTAAKQAESIKDGDSVRIGDCDVTCYYDKEKKITYTNYTIFNFQEDEANSGKNGGSTNSQPVANNVTPSPTEEDDDLPF